MPQTQKAKPVRPLIRPDRTYPRETVRWQAVWVDADGKTHQGEICDISAGGVFLRPVLSANRVQSGERLRLEFSLPEDGLLIHAAATVRFTGASRAHSCLGLGLQFDQPIAYLDNYLRQRSRPEPRV